MPAARINGVDNGRVVRGTAIALSFVAVLMTVCGGGAGSSSQAVAGDLNDTWVWDGTDWRQVHTSNAPSPRVTASIAYDDAAQDIVLFGGMTDDGTAYLNDTWTWDGDAWTQRHPAHSPEPRSQAAMVYDPTIEGLVLIGGFVQKTLTNNSTFLGPLDDVWKWDGADWSLIGHSQFPLSLSGNGASGFDPRSKEVVAVGDFGTESWDHKTWRVIDNPPAWDGGSVTYTDPTSGALTVLAAFANPDYSLTYRLESWNGSRWVAGRTIELPPGGWLDVGGAAYDSKRGQIVGYGGQGDYNRPLTQTLVFDGTTWSTKQPQHTPPARIYAYMVFNSDSGLTLMFGGHT